MAAHQMSDTQNWWIAGGSSQMCLSGFLLKESEYWNTLSRLPEWLHVSAHLAETLLKIITFLLVYRSPLVPVLKHIIHFKNDMPPSYSPLVAAKKALRWALEGGAVCVKRCHVCLIISGVWKQTSLVSDRMAWFYIQRDRSHKCVNLHHTSRGPITHRPDGRCLHCLQSLTGCLMGFWRVTGVVGRSESPRDRSSTGFISKTSKTWGVTHLFLNV